MTTELHFFTGFPGFLSTHFVRKLLSLRPDAKIIALVRQRTFESAQKKIDLAGWTQNIQLVVGDITQENLGIENPKAIVKKITHIWHLAALYDLTVANDVAQRINVEGTKKVVLFAESCKKLKHFNYVSTSYISGKREGTIFEDELNENQEFNNFYELTKFLAEEVVQDSDLPYTIFRPSIIVGDSKNGKTEKFDGPYYLFKMLRELPKWLPTLNVNSGSGGVNIIPVDFATDAIVNLGFQARSLGHTFHICDTSPMTPTEIIELSLKTLGMKKSFGRVPHRIFKFASESDKIEKMLGIPRQVLDYFNHNANYDCTNASEHLLEFGISCPHLSTYLPKLIDYYETQNPPK